MRTKLLRNRGIEHQLEFLTSRSSGPGGQNVNKVNSKVEIRLNISESALFSEHEKNLIFNKSGNKINKDGYLTITSEEHRSQHKNKEVALEKLYTLLEKALAKPKKRKPTKPTKKSIENRLNEKKLHGQKKTLRKKTF